MRFCLARIVGALALLAATMTSLVAVPAPPADAAIDRMLIVSHRGEPSSGVPSIPPNFIAEFTNNRPNAGTQIIQDTVELGNGQAPPAGWLTGYDLVVILGVFNNFDPADWTAIQNAVTNKESDVFLMFIDYCGICGAAVNQPRALNLVNNVQSKFTASLGPGDSVNRSMSLNTASSSSASFVGLPVFRGDAFRPFRGVPDENVLYKTPSGDAYALLIPQGESTGACVFFTTDASGFDEFRYPDNRNLIAPAFYDAANGGACFTADLALTGSVAPEPVARGNEVTYTFTVDNAGPQPAVAPQITYTLPPGAVITGGTGCAEAVPTTGCTLGDLADGATANVTVKATLVQSGTMTATVASNTTDRNHTNNSVTLTDTVLGSDDDSLTILGNTSGTVDVLANDDHAAGLRSLTDDGTGTAAGTAVFDPATGNLAYTPALGEDGDVTVDYTACTGTVCSSATVTITVQADTDGDGIPDSTDPDDDNDGNPDTTDPNRLVPTAVDDSGSTTPNTPVTIDVLGNDDFIPGAGTSITRTGGTALGSAVFDPATGNLTYTPALGETTGSVTVDYRACGTASTPNGCDDATVTIALQLDTDGDGIPDGTDPDDDNDGNPDVTDPNPLVPTAVDDSGATVQGTPVTIDIVANDDFLTSTPLTLTATGGTAAGTSTFDPVAGTLTYTPAPSEVTGTVVVNYQVCHTGVTPAVCADAAVSITITDSGTPVAVDDAATAIQNGPAITIDAVGNDTLVDGATYSAGSLNRTGTSGTVADNGDGMFGYTPAPGFSGIDTFTYQVCDDDLPTPTCSTATVIITVQVDTDGDGIPDATDPDDDNDGNPDTTDPNPVVATATDDSGSTTPNTPVVIDVLGNDDTPPSAQTTITRTGGTATGTAVFDPATGNLTYTPAITETTGSVTVGYEVCHTASTPNGCATATVTIEIQLDTDGDGIPDDIDPDDDNDGNPDTTDPNPLTPSTAPDLGFTKPGREVTIDILTNDDFIPSSDISIATTGGTAAGTSTFDPKGGAVTYVPSSGENAEVTILYQVCFTPTGVCGENIITITITPSGVITGVVHNDRDRDQSAANDAQLAGVVIELVDADGVVVASDTTASPFVFADLDDGMYTVRVVDSSIPTGMYPTTPTMLTAAMDGSEVVTRNFGLTYALITGTARTFEGQIIPNLGLELIDGEGTIHKAVTQLDGTYRLEGSAARPLIAGNIELSTEIDGSFVGGDTRLDRHVPLVFDAQGPPPTPTPTPAPAPPVSSPPVVLAFTGVSGLRLALLAIILIELGSISLASARQPRTSRRPNLV